MVHVTPRQGSKSLPVLHLRPGIVSIPSRGYIHNIRFSLSMEKNRLTRDGTAEPVSRDQFPGHELGQGKIHFPCSADHEQDWSPYPVDPSLAMCDDHTYIHTIIVTINSLDIFPHSKEFYLQCLLYTVSSVVIILIVIFFYLAENIEAITFCVIMYFSFQCPPRYLANNGECIMELAGLRRRFIVF